MQRKTQEEVWKEYVLRTLRQFRRILTTQGSHIGEVISTDGTDLIWTTASSGSSLPDQSGNNGKYLTTNGSTASWATVTIPSGIVTISDVGTVTNTMLAGSIANNKLINSTITLNGRTVALGDGINLCLSSNTTVNSSTTSLSLASSDIFSLTMNTSTTLTFANPRLGTYIFRITQDATGGRTITWPANVKWSGGITPTLTTTGGKTDVITLIYDSVNFYGAYMLNF